MTEIFSNLKLCYVKENWAYFTSCPLELQWGDDWNDAPYEHNAEEPYDRHYQIVDGAKKYVNHTIVKVAWDGCLDPPCAGYTNSYWSVEQINNGDVPWLSNNHWSTKGNERIYAGASLSEFVSFVRKNDGDVYIPSNQSSILIGQPNFNPERVREFKGEF